MVLPFDQQLVVELVHQCESHLLDQLLCEAPDSDGRFSEGRSVTAGVFHRYKVRLQQLCRSHPQSVRVLNRFIVAICPNFFHTSFVAIDGIASREHKDHLNSDLPNVVIPLCDFKGGELVAATMIGIGQTSPA